MLASNIFPKNFLLNANSSSAVKRADRSFYEENNSPNYQVNFSHSPDIIKTREKVKLNYFIEHNGKAFMDIEPYLGAAMHITAISSDLRTVIHEHAMQAKTSLMEHTASSTDKHLEHEASSDKISPNLEANITFPVKGIYHIFSELKHKGKIIVSNSIVEVE